METNNGGRHNGGRHIVAVVGAGPAGLFAARELAMNGVEVVLLNRDIKPGGLAEYGIYPDKLKMKEGLRNQFRQILAHPAVSYFGNVTVGNNGDLTLDELRQRGFHAILITAGAQGTKWLGLPGEHLTGVYHAKDIVYAYNLLPAFVKRRYHIGRKVAVIGVGNVMTDIARYLIVNERVDEVIAIARRGPAEIKFDKKELEAIAANIDLAALDTEIDRASGLMQALEQDPETARAFIHQAALHAMPNESRTRMLMRFLLSPVRVIGDDFGMVTGLELEENTLLRAEDGTIKARPTGSRVMLEIDTVIFAIGDRVDDNLGLPVAANEYVKNPAPRFPVDGESYEAFNPGSGEPIADTFVAGWSRQASTGLVGLARKDGVNGTRAVLRYLQDLAGVEAVGGESIRTLLLDREVRFVDKPGLERLAVAEKVRAVELGLESYKFSTNEEMLAVIEAQQV